MTANAVNAWDRTVLAASESTFGTAVNLAASQALRMVSVAMGKSSQTGNVRPVKDRPSGRGMVSEYLEGDVEPFDFALEYSQRGRSAVDAAAFDLAILKAAGLKQTINGSTSTVISLVPTPIENGEFASLQLARFLGSGSALAQAEVLQGCVVKSLVWSGGGQEVMVKASGQGISKAHAGRIDSITFASGATTSVTLSVLDAAKLSPGMAMQCESEAVTVSTVDYTTGVTTFVRGAYSTSAAAHTAKPLYPYVPASLSYGGVSPLSEANASAILGTISPIRIIDWTVELTTGMDLLPAETSSQYRQGPKSVRHDVKVKMKAVLSQDRTDLMGLARARSLVQLTLNQGTGVGGIMSFVLPYCEVMPFEVPDTAGDIAIVDLELRTRNNGTTGDNAMSITLT